MSDCIDPDAHRAQPLMTTPDPTPGRRGPLRALVSYAVLPAVSIVMAIVVLELAVRVYHGDLLNRSSQLAPPPNRAESAHAQYDPQLGWVPKIGTYQRSAEEVWRVNEAGLRSNGPPFSSAKRPIVAVGDSFTFGDEAQDHETWPAQLEQRLHVPVLNGGVFAYGIDQAFLRATSLLEAHDPAVVVLAFISDDINRAELSFYYGWKPYFEYIGDELLLRNVPVPTGPGPSPAMPRVRQALSYSFLFSAILRRAAPQWWFPQGVAKAHADGERVAVDLFARLQSLTEARGARLVVVALGTNGRIGNNLRTPQVVQQARRRGIDVLNLLPAIEQLTQESQTALFKSRGHYSPSMNGRVAAGVAAFLNQQ
jgi:lysophospholipase L1-like esterase